MNILSKMDNNSHVRKEFRLQERIEIFHKQFGLMQSPNMHEIVINSISLNLVYKFQVNIKQQEAN